MNTQDEERWQNLMAMGAPAFAGEDTPPYGFMTSMLARVRADQGQREWMERIGLRALFASLGVLAVTAVLTLGSGYFDHSDLEPGLKTFVQVENVPVS